MPCKVAAIITAAGSSTRMGGIKKEYCVLKDYAGVPAAGTEALTVLGACVTAFASCAEISAIVITVPANAEQGEWAARKALPPSLLGGASSGARTPVFFVPGGGSRRLSVHHALSFLQTDPPDYVLIHDGARPWVSPDLIKKVMEAALEAGAVIPVLPLLETPKELDGKGFVVRHLKRAACVGAQTPQGFRFADILAAHEKAAALELEDASAEWTDDAEIWGAFTGPVAVVTGEKQNRKITFPEDL
ncbi:2-C-methyl-D-erythritol 4-phosphate cytidylyltransferase [Spirochaetia bacterium]|nr:2-C-methyl-D-erythritol 4-phosphate cytidylyltransferase [Spirochaetia bacterium]